MFSWYKYLIVNLVFSYLGFWSGNLFLIAPFPDLCLLVPFHSSVSKCNNTVVLKNYRRTYSSDVVDMYNIALLSSQLRAGNVYFCDIAFLNITEFIT